MVSPNKRAAESVEDDMTTPKKVKNTPAKKTPKVVKLEPGTPKSPAALNGSALISSPLVATTSAKKAVRKTPAKQKALDSVNTPKNIDTPQAGKLSQPSPVQTRSARKKKAELNSTIGTPVSKSITPKKGINGKNLNSKTTPKSKNSTPVSKNKGNKSINEDLKLKLEDEDLDSDDDVEPNNDSDDVPSDNEIIDKEQAEKLKAELLTIINKPISGKSILKAPKKEPVELAEVRTPVKAKTPAKISSEPVTPKANVPKTPSQQESKTIVDTLAPCTPKIKVGSGEVPHSIESGKRPSPMPEKTPSKKARRSIVIKSEPTEQETQVQEVVQESAMIVDSAETKNSQPQAKSPAQTPKKGKKSPLQTNNSAGALKIEATTPTTAPKEKGQAKTPKDNQAAALKTPAKENPVQTKTPAKEIPTKAKTPAKENKAQAKTPAKEVPTAVITPAKEVQAHDKTHAKENKAQAKTPEAEKTPAKEVPTAVKTPAKAKTPAKENKTQGKTPETEKTPAKENKAQTKTPAKGTGTPTPAKTKTAKKTPVKDNQIVPKTPEMEAQGQAKTPVKENVNLAKNQVTPKTPGAEDETVPKPQAEKQEKQDQVPAKEMQTKKSKRKAKKAKQALAKSTEKETLNNNEEPKAQTTQEIPEVTKESTDVATEAKSSKVLAKVLKRKANKEKKNISSGTVVNGTKTEDTKVVENENDAKVEKPKKKKKKVKSVLPKPASDSTVKVPPPPRDTAPILFAREIAAKMGKYDATKHDEKEREVREKLVKMGKSEEEIAEDIPRIMFAIQKRESRTRCLRCRRMGHLQKDCPTSGAKVASKCYKCGDTSHQIKNCHIKEDVYTYAECFICHQTGHLTRTCPSNTNGIYPLGGACYRCGDKNHLSRSCPGNKVQDENAKPAEINQKKPLVGVLDVKQSADADVELEKPLKNTTKKGKKKQVVTF